MRPLLFLVADKNMEYALKGFFERKGWYKAVPCAPFALDTGRDIRVAPRRDPELYTRARDLLAGFSGRYESVVVMVDAAWDGSPGAEEIRERLNEHIRKAGWPAGRGLALVLEPELDVWLWSDSVHVPKAMGWKSWAELRRALEEAGWLYPGTPKPHRPKEAAEWALRKRHTPRSSSLYRKICGLVSLDRCTDPALRALRDALRRWFPPEADGFSR